MMDILLIMIGLVLAFGLGYLVGFFRALRAIDPKMWKR